MFAAACPMSVITGVGHGARRSFGAFGATLTVSQ